MKPLGWIVVAFVLLVGGVGVLVLTQPGPLAFLIRNRLKRQAPMVCQFNIESVDYTFPASWELGAVSATLDTGHTQMQCAAERVYIKDLLHCRQVGAPVFFKLEGVSLQEEALLLSGGSMMGSVWRMAGGVAYSGQLELDTLRRKKVRLSELTAVFAGTNRHLSCSALEAAFYGGSLIASGQGRIEKEKLEYAVELTLEEMDCTRASADMGGVLQELNGALSGHLSLVGHGRQLDRFDTRWEMPAGGAVDAALLSQFIEYIPDDAAQERIDFLVRSGRMLPVESFMISAHNSAPDQLGGIVSLKSREANLELNVTHEVRVDTRIDALWSVWKEVQEQKEATR